MDVSTPTSYFILDILHFDSRSVHAPQHLLGNGGMLRLSVPSEIDFPLKCFLTKSTREGLVTGVLAHVSD